MRRPVLPSSGQAYDEVNIARFSAAGKSQCPVSGAPLECHRRGPSKGKVMLTPDYALRNVIRHQAQQAKVCALPHSPRALLRPFLCLGLCGVCSEACVLILQCCLICSDCIRM